MLGIEISLVFIQRLAPSAPFRFNFAILLMFSGHTLVSLMHAVRQKEPGELDLLRTKLSVRRSGPCSVTRLNFVLLGKLVQQGI